MNSPDHIAAHFDHPNRKSSGWLSPEGRMYFCDTYDHAEASRILAARRGWKEPWSSGGDRYDGDEWLVRRGWLRLCGPEAEGIRWMGVHGDGPGRPTAEQRNALSRMGYDPDDGLSPLPTPSGVSDDADWPW
jgi:hypothetical protein